MVSILNLLWIIPLAASAGYMLAALMCAAKDEEVRHEKDA